MAKVGSSNASVPDDGSSGSSGIPVYFEYYPFIDAAPASVTSESALK
jgi:hypothetical protein